MARKQHDPRYKRMFSYPEMVRDLLIEYVREDWVRELDFSTLEKQNGSYVADDDRDRHDDLVWRVRWGKDWLYVYLLLEFQSRIERFMAVRIITYLGLLYQDLIAQDKLTAGRLLPPVLPVVLYNGDHRWSAKAEIGELIERIPGGLERYRPRMRHLVLDQKALLREDTTPELRGLVHALFRLEHSRSPQEVLATIGKLCEWLHTPEQHRLRREFAIWIQRVLLRRKPFAKEERHDWQEVDDIGEVREMLEDRVREWEKQWEQAGIRKGVRRGMQKGVQKGEAAVLLRQIERKFGPEAAEAHRERIEQADAETLLEWSEYFVTADHVEAVFHPS